MRGICALIVVILHCDGVLGTERLFRHGWLSVDVFFVMSGFVIALVYEDRLQAVGGFGAFMRARAKRLLPVQIVGTLFGALSCLALYWTGHRIVPGLSIGALFLAMVFGLFLIPISLSPVAGIFSSWEWGFPINPPLWSLHGEWIVNIIYGRFLFAVRTPALLAIYGCLAVYLLHHLLHVRQEWDMTFPYEIVPNLARAAVGFVAGVMIYRAADAGLLRYLPLVQPETIYACWLLICTVPLAHPMPIFEAVAALVLAPLSIMLLVRNERSLRKPYLALGALSYPLYASHFAIVNLSLIWIVPGGGRLGLLWLFPMLLAAFALAWAVDRMAQLMPPLSRQITIKNTGLPANSEVHHT